MGANQSQLDALPSQKSPVGFSSISTIEVPPIPSISKNELGPRYASQTKVPSRANDSENSRFGFLDLPPEIRNMIYKELMVVGKVFYSPDEYDVVNGSRYHNYELFRKPELQLLRLCKQIHVEVESVYLSKNIFVLPIQWQRCHPFMETCDPSDHITLASFNKRHLFSSMGLSRIKRISVAIDQKLAEHRAYSFDSWNRDKTMCPDIYFAQTTQHERLEGIHDQVVQHMRCCWEKMLGHLKVLEGGLSYVEVDFTNAFCGIGDCRPLRGLSMQWVQQVKPMAIDILGMLNMEEKQDFISSALQCGIRHNELRYTYGLRFQKVGSAIYWKR